MALNVRVVESPVQFGAPQFGSELAYGVDTVRARRARGAFGVDGTGLAVAVLDTGLRSTHCDFTGRVVAQRDFVSGSGVDHRHANDGHGHGTNVAGIIAASGRHVGIAPGVDVIPLKVLNDLGGGSFEAVRLALRWVATHRATYNISAVCVSFSDGANHQSDDRFAMDEVLALIADLRASRVAVVASAGNEYFTHHSRQGMGYPAIVRQTISVGAVYEFREGGFRYSDGAEAFATAPERIAPFSQRLHPKHGGECRTDILAAGTPITSAAPRTTTANPFSAAPATRCRWSQASCCCCSSTTSCVLDNCRRWT